MTVHDALKRMKVAPGMVCDALMWGLDGRIEVNPALLERWLLRGGMLKRSESVAECVERHWGVDVADAVVNGADVPTGFMRTDRKNTGELT